jgi:hypothetical protein
MVPSFKRGSGHGQLLNELNAVGRDEVGHFTGKKKCHYGQNGVGREAICLLSFPLFLRLAFVIPGIVSEIYKDL